MSDSRAIRKLKFPNLTKKQYEPIRFHFLNKISVYFTLISSFFFHFLFQIVLTNYTSGSTFLGKQFCKMTELFWVIPTFCISVFQFQATKLFVIDEISICLHDLKVFFKVFPASHKLWKGGTKHLGVNQFCRTAEKYLVIPFYISILET